MFSPLSWRSSTLFILTVLLEVYSYIPALPSNRTDSSSTGIEGQLDVYVYNITTPTSITLRSAVVPPNYPGDIWGALVHFSDEDGVGVNTTAFDLPVTVILVSCDSNSTNPPQEDIFYRARDLYATAGVLYSRYSETCVLTPGYNGSDANMPVFLSPSLNTSRAIEELFNKVDGRYDIWDPQTLQSEFHNITYGLPYEGILDPGYLSAQAFWNASEAPSAAPPLTTASGAATDAVNTYHVLFSILGAFTVSVLC
ncbi:hypothetical protein LXA43DRAFT_599984 [Ganoderma leucocontextum]|nr:hypothetical protein LXA43DRAFT_599984 [Ganoderma leucocontextum]